MAKEYSAVEHVKLGFIEKCEPWLITNRFFPCKVGGKPAWLELKNLPKNEEILCPKCNKPRIFLCQIYAPIDLKDDCFHRTIFIFICRNESCYELNSSENIIAFRSQLPHLNDYYPKDPPDENIKLPEIEGPLKLCNICGCYGQFKCSKCGKVNYCGQEHQKLDWKYHKKVCEQKEIKVHDIHTSEVLFPENEIASEIEPENAEFIEKSSDSENEELSEKRRLQEYEEFIKTDKVGDLNDIPESELSKFVMENVEDKEFSKFKKRIEHDPEQVVRYQRNGYPLWISKEPTIVKENQIPNCEYCNSKRTFEFQIMPQLLSYLNDDKIDWGVIAVYTCSQSCNTNSQYLKEFVIKQDILPTEKR